MLPADESINSVCSVVKATFDALTKMKDANTVAQLRGISLEKVFKG